MLKKYMMMTVGASAFAFSANIAQAQSVTGVVVGADHVNVRSHMGVNNPLVTRLDKGTTVQVISSEKGWYNIKINDNKTGWISGFYLKLNNIQQNTQVQPNASQQAQPKQTEQHQSPQQSQSHEAINAVEGVVYGADSVNVRSHGGTNSSIVGHLKRDTVVKVLGTENGWYNIKFDDNKTGWISGFYLKLNDVHPQIIVQAPQAPTHDVVNELEGVVYGADSVNVRSHVGTNSSIIGHLKKDTVVKVLGTENGWYNIKFDNNKTGWISGFYLKLNNVHPQIQSDVHNNQPTSTAPHQVTTTTPQAPIKTTAPTSTDDKVIKAVVEGAPSVNLRSSSDIHSSITGHIAINTVVEVISSHNGWYKIKLSNNATAWISGHYLKLV